MPLFLLQVGLELVQLAGYLFFGLAHIYLYYIVYILAVSLVKSLYKLVTQVYYRSLKVSSSRDRAILITGATSGIGLALSKYFNAQGYKIIAGYYTDKEDGYDELMKLNRYKGGKAIFLVHVDVRSQESIKESYEKVSEILSQHRFKLHALINNAGITHFYPAHWTRRKDIVAMAETNFIGPMLMVRQYMPLLIKTQDSRIVNVSSSAGRLPFPYNVVYCATKAGLAMFGNSLALDISNKYDIKVVTIFLGNAVQHTAIANQASSEVNATFEEFSSEERALYENEFRGHEKGLIAFERFVKGFQAGATRRLSKIIDMSTQLPTTGRWLLSSYEPWLDDDENRFKLENSCFMNGFDNAINMKDPPGEISTGNLFDAIFVSSFLDTLGHDMVQLFSSLCNGVMSQLKNSYYGRSLPNWATAHE